MGGKIEECHIPYAHLQHFSFQDRRSSKPLVTGVHFYIYSTQGIKAIEHQYRKVTGWSCFDTAGTCLKEASSFRDVRDSYTVYSKEYRPKKYLLWELSYTLRLHDNKEKLSRKTEYEKYHKQFQQSSCEEVREI